MKYSYQAFDRSGKVVSSTIDAGTPEEAAESLRREGLYVTNVSEAGETTASSAAVRRRRVRTGLRLKNLAAFTRQLHVLVASGTPMVQALTAVERQASGEQWRQVIAAVRQQVEEGVALSAAMADYPEYFDDICRSLAAAGESGGAMADMLSRLSALTRKQLHLRNSIIGAMVYPSVLIVTGVVVLFVMLFFVLPRFVELFRDLGVPLPPTTRLLITTSEMLRSYWWIMLPSLIVPAVAVRMWLAGEQARRLLHSTMLRIPRFGGVVRNVILARIARLLGVLLESHVPLLEALKLTKQAAGNLCYVELISRAEDIVSRGEAVSLAFSDSELVTPSINEAIRSGEQSGRIGALLLQVADFLDEDNDVVVRSLTSIIEPLILIGLGSLVAFIAVSMFMPLFDLAAMAQGGGR